MRTWLVVKVAMVALLVSCAVPDKHRAYFHDDTKYPDAFSATHLGQDFDERSVTDLLSPGEREALQKTDWQLSSDRADAADFASLGAEPSTGDKVAGTTMTVVGMAITVGAMVAPYLLF